MNNFLIRAALHRQCRKIVLVLESYLFIFDAVLE